MKGRKPKPSATRKLDGNPGKRAGNKREPKPQGGAPSRPAHLKGAAATEWKRMVSQLKPLGLVTQLDRAALAAYCVAYGRWVEAEGNLREKGPVVKSPSGFPIQNPYLAIANKAMGQMQKLLVEFGMTPSSRTRVEVKPTKEENVQDAFLQFEHTKPGRE